MKRLSIVIVLLILISFLPLTRGVEVVLTITPLNNNIPALPGQTVVIPFQIRNLGNTTLGNVTVYVTGPSQGFLYQTELIRTPIPPNGTVKGTITVKVLNVPPGSYNLTLVARSGSFYAQAQVTVKVGLLLDYYLDVEVGKSYIYGHDVTIVLKAVSKANGVLLGSVGYRILLNGTVIMSGENSTYLNPGESWVKVIRLKKPQIGNYTVLLWANFGGKFKSITKTFRVYQRHLLYKAYFQNGAIHVLVYNSTGGVPGILVKIDGIEFTTDENGEVSYSVNQPGIYKIVLDLDGKIVTTFVDVKKLFVNYEQRNSTLIVKVVDSTGTPVPNVTIVASGPLGKEYAVTNSSGATLINLNVTGYGTIILSAESDKYVGGQAVLTAQRPPEATKTSSTVSTSSSFIHSINTTLVQSSGKGKSNYGLVGFVLIIAGLLLAGTSYLAFAVPEVQEETLDRYYFIKIRAPKLRELKGYRVERQVSVLEARATKGKVEIEEGRLVWELDLEAGEEAYLQAVLG
ncbi:COG1470 family protein [Thermococcus sp.]